MNYDIKITGNGTQSEIIRALERVISSLKGSTPTELTHVEWEDHILMTEVWVVSPSKKYEPSEDDIENDAFNREAGYESD